MGSNAMEQSSHAAVYSVLRNILEDEVDPNEIQQIDDEPRTQKGALSRLKDDLINLASLQKWFMQNLVVSEEHNMSMKELWRHFCYDNGVPHLTSLLSSQRVCFSLVYCCDEYPMI